jgi:hypothetical protein
VSPSRTETTRPVCTAASDGQKLKNNKRETSKINLKINMPQLIELISHKAKMLKDMNLNACKTPQL